MLVTLTVPVSSLVVGLGGLVAVRSPAHGRPAGNEAKRVEVVVEEHHDYAQIIDAPDAPFLSWLVQRGALLGGYFGARQPSLPDSRAMLDDDALGIDCACVDGPVSASQSNLIDRLEAAGISWAAYLHGPPTPCPDTRNTRAYAKQRNPFAYLGSIRRDPQHCKNVVPFERFAADLAFRRLPQLVFVVPDRRYDLHDGSVAPADAWLVDLCRPLATSTAWGGGDTRLVVTFDENRDGEATCYPGYRPLRTTEEEPGLGYLGRVTHATTIPATIG
ncbi:MAG: alkaline phosphatase family protein [Egibacteraceae bacterium]